MGNVAPNALMTNIFYLSMHTYKILKLNLSTIKLIREYLKININNINVNVYLNK